MRLDKPRRQKDAFFEGPDSPTLIRRALSEGVATAALTMIVVFSARATWLGEMKPLALIVGVPAALASLILTFGPATGGHFNPLVTGSQWICGHRNTRCLIGYVIAQCFGALGGAALAALLVDPAPRTSSPPMGLVIGGEIFASAGLIAIVMAASLVMSPRGGLLAVIGWVVMINLAVPAGPFANPVLAVAAPLALGAFKAPDALIHVASELAGAGIGLLVIAVSYPAATSRRRE